MYMYMYIVLYCNLKIKILYPHSQSLSPFADTLYFMRDLKR